MHTQAPPPATHTHSLIALCFERDVHWVDSTGCHCCQEHCLHPAIIYTASKPHTCNKPSYCWLGRHFLVPWHAVLFPDRSPPLRLVELESGWYWWRSVCGDRTMPGTSTSVVGNDTLYCVGGAFGVGTCTNRESTYVSVLT